MFRRSRPSAALIVASIALIVALGGVSAAATGLINGATIEPGTIGHRQLAKHSVQGNNLTRHAVALANLTRALQRQINNRAKVTLPSQSGTPGTSGTGGSTGATGAAGAAGSNGAAGAGGPQGPSANVPLAITSFGSTYGPNTFQAAPYGDNSATVEACAPSGRGGEAAGGTNGTVAFATPPAAPPFGSKALEMTATNGKSVVTYLPQDGCKSNELLSQLTVLAYSSLVVSRNASDVSGDTDMAMQIEVTGAATGTTSGYTTMVYEPYLNGQAGATTWTMHNVAAGKVWSTHALTTGDCTQASPCPYAQFQADNPNAVIGDVKLRIGQNSGAGWPGFNGYADNVWLNSARYDLGG